MKQAAYKGTHLEVKDVKDQTFHQNNFRNEKQELIELALLEINNGCYEKAFLLLDKAKKQYSSDRAEELQKLILKLQTHSFNSDEQSTKNNSKSSFVSQQNDFHSEEEEIKSRNDYTNEQLTLVKKINSCKNYYQVLSVTHDASESEIKKAYKRLAFLLHPDKNHAPGAAEAFKALGNAVAMITDTKERKGQASSTDYYTAPNTKTFNFYESTSSQQEYFGYGNPHYYYSPTRTKNRGNEEFTADELFHMFFGDYSSTQSHHRRRPYQSANQRQPQEQSQHPSLAFGLLLVMILMSMFISLFSTDPLYSLTHSG